MTPSKEPWFEVAEESGLFHWQLWSTNGQAVARNAVGYKTQKACVSAIRIMQQIAGSTKLVIRNHGDEQEEPASVTPDPEVTE